MSKSTDNHVSHGASNKNANGKASYNRKSDAVQHNKPVDSDSVRNRKVDGNQSTPIHAKNKTHDPLLKYSGPNIVLENKPS